MHGPFKIQNLCHAVKLSLGLISHLPAFFAAHRWYEAVSNTVQLRSIKWIADCALPIRLDFIRLLSHSYGLLGRAVANCLELVAMESMGARLKGERRKAGLSQQEFALVGGVAANAQWQYENGRRIPRADYLAAIAKSGVDILFIVLGQRTPVAVGSLNHAERAMLQHYRFLDAGGKAAIERFR